MDLHTLVSQLKEIALERGRAPTKGEFCAEVPGASYWFDKNMTWTDFLHAAGFPTYAERRSRGEGTGRLTNKIFERSVADILNERPPPVEVPATKPVETTLIIPDTHFPWVNNRVLDRAYEWAQRFKPARVVQLGDLYDMYAHAKFPRSLNIYRPEEEERIGREAAEKFWASIKSIVPEAECIQLKGNHDVRPLKRTLENVPALEHVVSRHLDKLMTFDGVTLIADPRQEYIVGDIEFLHGYKSRLGEHRDYALMNAVCGHIHVGGVVFRKIRGQILWELNCGLAGDPEAKVFGYTSQKISNWTGGFGAIDPDGPRFIPVP